MSMTLKVGEYANKITKYIVKTQEMNMPAESLNSFMAWGPPGVGKSAATKTIAKQVEAQTGKKVNITDVRLLLFNPVDLRGMPIADVKEKVAIWLRPQIFVMDPSPNVINILMLDEISACPPSVQAAAYQITLDRQIGEHKLPDNCYVICAGNRMQDKSVAYKMPRALANRLTHFDIETDIDDWKVWAYANGIHEKVTAYLNFQPNRLVETQEQAKQAENAFPTPRTWEMVSNYLKIYDTFEEAYPLICGTVGMGTASEFKQYCNVYSKLPDIEGIFEGKKDIPVPTEPDVLYATAGAIAYKAAKLDKKDLKKLENAFDYVQKVQKEFSIKIIKDMILIPELKSNLLQIKSFMAYIKKNKSFII